MYTTVNVCQKYSRLIEAEEDEDIPAIEEEISYLFAPKDSRNCQKYTTLQNKTFCNRNFDQDSKALYSIAMKYHRQAEDSILADNSTSNMTQVHKYIIDLLTIHRHLKLRQDKAKGSGRIQGNINFSMYKSSILKFTELPASALQKLVSGLVNKHQDASVKAYFHLMLDVMWLFITMKDKDEGANETNEIVELLQQIHFVLYKCYEKLNKYFTVCTCVRVIFLRIQLFCEETRLSFWEVFNASMDCYDEEFSLCALKFQAELQCYASNGKYVGGACHRIQDNVEFFNKNWSLLMKNSSAGYDNKVFRILAGIDGLLTNLWLDQSKLDFYYLTWDYYNKRIEEIKDQRSFHQALLLVNGTEPIDGHSQGLSRDVKANGYLIFLRMLTKHLGRHPNHWNKFKGRIYTKFPTSKVQKLSEQGLHNLATLFFALADVNFEETSGKLLGLLKDLPGTSATTGANQLAKETWNIYIFLIRQHLDRTKSLEEIHKAFGPLLEETSRNRNSFALVTLFANNLHQYFRCSDLTLKQSLFISPWLENYLKSCAHNDLISLLNTLSMIIDNVIESGTWYEYQKPFVLHVLTPLKRSSVNQSIIGTVAGLIVANTEGLDDVIEHFLSDAVSGDVMMSFFMTLRRKSTFTSTEKRESLTIKAWFLSRFIGVEHVGFAEEVFDLLRVKCKGLDTADLRLDKRELFEQFLGAVDKKTLHACLDNGERFLMKNLNLNVYTNMALVFHACGNHLYQPTASCKLQTYIEMFLLPLDVLRGKPPAFLPFVEKTWHLYMLSVWKLREEHSCSFLERTLKNLIVCYLPLFSTDTKVLVKVLSNHELTDFVLSTIAAQFLAHDSKKPVADQTLFKVLAIVEGVLNYLLLDSDNRKEAIRLFARRLLPALFEAYMFSNHKPKVMSVIESLVKVGNRQKDVKRAFATGFEEVMQKYVGFSTNQFFQMCHVLAKYAREDMRSFLGKIKAEIRDFGRRSGQGDDMYLHTHWNNLEKACK